MVTNTLAYLAILLMTSLKGFVLQTPDLRRYCLQLKGSIENISLDCRMVLLETFFFFQNPSFYFTKLFGG
jgi:hypothetical protein